ncbi:hypothetical protein CEXT_188321 [Caerostris extrusa]|uniref:LAGLIDADG homing endonuclease n=1 Tax=Caerostris extrusa TaxID=172846 RepID=A0AAV4TH61_CAEEX|nr:hypothetical protein CEXT_188321 [Caerostris extrusa]
MYVNRVNASIKTEIEEEFLMLGLTAKEPNSGYSIGSPRPRGISLNIQRERNSREILHLIRAFEVKVGAPFECFLGSVTCSLDGTSFTQHVKCPTVHPLKAQNRQQCLKECQSQFLSIFYF